MLPKRKAAYEKLKFYQDICELRRLVFIVSERFRKMLPRLVSQMRDAARSAKQNIGEGYRKGSLGEYIHSIKISQGSLEELNGDIDDCYEDELISKKEFDRFKTLLFSADYLSNRYLVSLYKMERDGTWKVPGANLRK